MADKTPKITSEYDVGKAFQAIENELLSSMIRNMERHKGWETREGFQWEMWQAMQLESLEKYKKKNAKKYGEQFKSINSMIETIIRQANQTGRMEQEIAILEAIKNGFPAAKNSDSGLSGEFFQLNEQKLDALINATTNDLKTAETAILRQANDQYRKVIYNAQVYANTGAGTYKQAIDMATKDLMAAGLNCVEYKNGARHTLADYADMAVKTANKRAYLTGEGTKRQEWKIYTVIVNKRGKNGSVCPKCLPHCGKVYIDDVWSGGPKDGISPLTGKKYPLISSAISDGLYHPRCKDSHTTYFEGISTPPDGEYSKEELALIEKENKQEAREQYAERQIEKYDRLAKYSLDEENQQKYAAKAKQWKKEIAKSEKSGRIASDRVEASANFVNKHEKLHEYAKDIKPLDGYEDVVCHANPDNFIINLTEDENSESIIMSATEMAEHIKASKNYHGGAIRLISCQAGAKAEGVAQQLADVLNVNVLAPTEIVNVNDLGDVFVSDSDTLAEMWLQDEKVNQTGKWVLFKPKR